MEKVKAFVFKQRRLASLIWLWGVLGTVIIAFTIDFLANSFVISPYYGEVFWLIPIYYFFTLFLSYQAYISRPLFKSIIQFIGQMAIFIIIFSFWGFYDTFMTTDYQENKPWLEEEVPSNFTEDTKLAFPDDAELIHTSVMKWGANYSKNIIFRVNDINSFSQQATEKYLFDNVVMDFPNIDTRRLGESNGNVLLPPFCTESKSINVSRYFKFTREVTNPEDFCDQRDALFTQVRLETEIGILMVILPKEKLVWLSSSYWF